MNNGNRLHHVNNCLEQKGSDSNLQHLSVVVLYFSAQKMLILHHLYDISDVSSIIKLYVDSLPINIFNYIVIVFCLCRPYDSKLTCTSTSQLTRPASKLSPEIIYVFYTKDIYKVIIFGSIKRINKKVINEAEWSLKKCIIEKLAERTGSWTYYMPIIGGNLDIGDTFKRLSSFYISL